MSRIGKKAINLPNNVTVELNSNQFVCSGPLGKIKKSLPVEVDVKIDNSVIVVGLKDNNPNYEKYTGLTRTLISNCVIGVVSGFSKNLEIVGVGYKAEVRNNSLNLNLGYSHPINFPIPEGISIAVEKNTLLKISGFDKEVVGLVAARIRSLRKPEPYKGKGIKYSTEVIKRKVGKASGKK